MTNPTQMPDLAIWLRERIGRTLYYRHWVVPHCRKFVAVPVRVRTEDLAWWIGVCMRNAYTLAESRKVLRDAHSKATSPTPIPSPAK